MKRIIMLLTGPLVMAGLLAVFAWGALAQTAPAGTLDANNLEASSAGFGVAISSEFANGQTFTVKRSGALTGARVHLAKWNNPGDLTVQIANVDDASGLPAVPEDVIASTTIPSSSFPNTGNTGSFPTVDVVFDAPASVVAGTQYALILKATGTFSVFPPDMYIQELSSGNSYAGGMRIFQRNPFGSPPGQWESDSGGSSDTIFGIYVDSPDSTPPEVSSTSPKNNATGVPATANISATFLEEGSGIDRTTLTNSTFKVVQVKPTGNVSVSGTVSYDEPSQTATFDPLSSLPKGGYRATITTGVKDQAGNALSRDYTWQFTTAGPSNK